MPVTRSMKSYPINTATHQDSSELASASTTSMTDATASEHTRSTYATRTTGATTETDATPKSPRDTENRLVATPAVAPVMISRTPATPKTTKSVSSRGRRIELAKAREKLLKLQVELAAAHVASLEEDTEEEDDIEEATIREQRTTEWIQKSTLTLSLEPHHETVATGTVERNRDPAEPQTPPEPRGVTQQDQPTTTKSNVITAYDPLRTSRSEMRESRFELPEPRYTSSLPPARYQEGEANRIDYSELANALTLAARAMQPVNTHRSQELPYFNGASCDWLPYKTAYEESVNFFSEQENLSRLRRSLKGAAREAVQCLFVGITSAHDVMKLLESRFGRPDALALSELNKLRNLPRLNEQPKEICSFAARVINITATIKALKKTHYLYNAEIVRGVVEKLPSALRYRYYDFAAEQREDEPDLLTLSNFMERTASRCGSFAPAENIQTEDRRENSARKMTRSYHTQEARNNSARIESCPICRRDGHFALNCNTMKEAEVSTRWELAKKHRLCFRCLYIRKYKHACKPKRCNIDGCEHYHHQLLHATTPTLKQDTTMNGLTVASATEGRNKTVLLKIVPVQVEGPKGTCNTFALLDDGSTCSLIESAMAEKVGASGAPAPFYIEGVAGARIDVGESKRVRITLKGRNGKRYPITARTMESLRLSSQSVTRDMIRTCSHLKRIEDELVYEEGSPTILLGQDNWHLLLSHEVLRGSRDQPVASFTELGWVLHGTNRSRRTGRIHRTHHITVTEENEESMEELMKEHFSLESLSITPKRGYNDEERRALQLLEENTHPIPAGGYETCLLWRRECFTPPNNYDTAVKRLEHIEKKLDRDANLKKRYETQIRSLLENGYAEEAISATNNTNRIWYLPHFGVINPQKPEKLRIVHDAAARTKGISLNDMLLSGPDLLQSLPGVLMRFRQRKIAVTADIKDMFMRVTVRKEDRDMQRFLWRDKGRGHPPTEYRMKSVVFGATSSPCTAIYVKNKNAETFRSRHPEAATAIIDNHYVDDYLDSFDSEEEAIRISSQVAYIHSKANYFLQRWSSNSRRVRAELSPGSSGEALHLDETKILGMIWEPVADTLSFNINEHRVPTDILDGLRVPTKREALRTIMSIFDPLGIATPVTIQAKRILQNTWRSGIGWDDYLEAPQAEEWYQWMIDVKTLTQMKIPRCYAALSEGNDRQLHVFVDASASAYGAAAYWRVRDKDGNIYISLIVGKGKVAPLKVTSIPRLELQAAVLGSRLAQTTVEEHRYKPIRRYFWTDSRTVLTWIRNGPRDYKPYVSHRIAEIAENTKTNEWRWVPTKMNTADDVTRGTPSNFNSEHRWYRGPEFLYMDEKSWPQEEKDVATEMSEEHEERVHAVTHTTRITEALPKIERFSSWSRLIRTTARILQFIRLVRTPKKACGAMIKRNKSHPEPDPTWSKITVNERPVAIATRNKTTTLRNYQLLEVAELTRAELLWVRGLQQAAFNDEIDRLKKGIPIPTASRLSKLSLVIDNDDIIRLRSRITAAIDITHEQRSPAVLDGDSPWARLYIAWVHKQTHHGGFSITTNDVRQRYWLLRLRNSVRSELKKCIPCRIRRATPPQPSTGDHPPNRLAHHQRPFTYTGLDYFGPLTVTVGRGRQKRYGVIFTCLTTRAVHIEVAGDLSTDSAIMALRRFIARRGCPTELWSDQGTNLRGADTELRHAAQEALQTEGIERYIRWRFIPPSAPFMGGAWERLVRSVKTALYAVLTERAPREEVLTTLLAEAEHTLNSRPLTHVSTSPEDEDALTPNHLLLGGPSRVPMPGAFNEEDANCRRLWRSSQRLADMFWARWMKEYLPELQHRREPRATNGALSLGDLVLIADGTLPRNIWPRGIVVNTYPGPDGEVRAVDVRTNKGILRRPTKKLVVILPSREP